MALTANERMKRYRTKKKEECSWYDKSGRFRGWICKCCGVKKEVRDFRERGRGHETVCLVCRKTVKEEPKEEPKEERKEKNETRRQQNREAQQRHRDKELEMRTKKDEVHVLFFCEECEEWKDEDNFPVRGRGRGKVCLDCKGYVGIEKVETKHAEKLRKFAESPAGQKMLARREEMMRKYGFDN